MVVKTKSDDHFKHMIWTDEALDVEDEFKYFLDCLIQLEMQKNCIGTRIRFISMWVKVSKDEFFKHCMSIQLWTKHAYLLYRQSENWKLLRLTKRQFLTECWIFICEQEVWENFVRRSMNVDIERSPVQWINSSVNAECKMKWKS